MKNFCIPARRLLIAACVATLAACARSDDGDGLTDMQREDRDASASSAGLFSFANAQIANRTSDSAEPRSIDGITPPADDSSEPFAL
jgi:hypothetical protein